MSVQRGNYGGCDGGPGLSSPQLGCGTRQSRLQIEIRCGQLLSLYMECSGLLPLLVLLWFRGEEEEKEEGF